MKETPHSRWWLNPASPRGMSLLELLLVLGVIGLLLALLLPAVQAARETARRSHCANNLRQTAAACQLYHVAQQRFPASTSTWECWTWAFGLLPFLDQGALYERWDRRGEFMAAANLPLAATPLPVYKCPAAISDAIYLYGTAGNERPYATIDYKGCQSVNSSDDLLKSWGRMYWLDGVVSRQRVRAAQIADGLSHTLLIVESTGGRYLYDPDGAPYKRIPQIWYPTDGGWSGRALSGYSPTWQGSLVGRPACTLNCTNMYDVGPYSFHPGGALASLCDGSVHFLSEQTEPQVIGAMYCYFEGELTGDY
ncbi:MAG: DUF1559 domain-containing protein [Planctomycetaceae bacterium]|nr:DUF1559 domain-containing protein [Planctomycetaceae bacterium]